MLNSKKAAEESSFFETTLPYEAMVRLFLRNRLCIVAIVLTAVTAGAIFIRMARPLYTSSAKLYIEQTLPQLLKETQDNKNAKNYLYTQATILKSSAVFEDVLQKARGGQCPDSLRRLAEKPDCIAYLDRGLSVSVGKKDDVVAVSFTSPNAQEAADVTNAIVDAYAACSEGKVRSTSGQLLDILQTEKARTHQELMGKQQALTDFKKDNKSIIFSGNKEDAASGRLMQLSEAVTRAQLDVLDAEANYATVKAMASDSVQLRQYIQARKTEEALGLGTSENAVLRNKINTLQLQQEKLLRVLTPEHPSVKAMEDKIASTFEQLEAIEKEYVQAQQTMAQQQCIVARQKYEQIQGHFQQEQKAALEINEKQSEYLMLESEWQQTKKMCDLLDERIREIDVTENAGALNIHILERARASVHPSFPDVQRVLALSGVIGLGLGFGIALLRDFLDGRFCCDRQVQSVLRCSVAGVIPQMPPQVQAELVSYACPDSSAAQLFRKMCTTLFLGSFQQEARMLHICSARAGEGKSTVAANLGITMACAGQRTLLVDCNFSAPRVRTIFNLPSGCGIRELAQEKCTPVEAVQHTFIEGLDVLGCGQSAANPMYLMNNKHFHSSLNSLRARYDRILLDSEAFSSLPESLILSCLSDAVIVVMHGERADQKTALTLRKEHEAVGSRLSAVIINQVKNHHSCYQHDQIWRPGSGRVRMLPSLSYDSFKEEINPLHECQRL